jgi:ketosteroid isomerase-like protein
MRVTPAQPAFITLLLLCGPVLANTSHDVADIRKVMDTFHEAVVSHDGSRLATLFIPEGSTWLNVLKSPATVRVGSYQDFAKFVSTTKSQLNPRHTHIQIHTDGTIAAVYFDFVFLIDGREANQGSETWQLVKGADGWRIAAITYSSAPRL